MDDFLDFRLSREEVEGLDEGDLLWALMEPAWDDPEDTTPGQQLLAQTTYFSRRVQNGGLATAFQSVPPDELDAVHEQFERLGATEFAEALRAGERAIFGEKPPRSLKKREALLGQGDPDILAERLEPYTSVLEDELALRRHLRRYVEAHPEEFFRD